MRDTSLTGFELKERGHASIALTHETWMRLACSAVDGVRRRQAFLTIEDVRRELEQAKIGPPGHHNAWGAVMRMAVARGYVTPTNEIRTAQRPQAHARLIRVWKAVPYRGA